jgi:ABC-type Mn2+/Zn2+ transport system ATPase subunit
MLEPARLDIDRVTIAYEGTPILRDLSFQVPHGAQVAVVGPNGAGKSTLFKALVGLLPLQEGRILVHGRPMGSHKDCVAYVPQRGEVDWRFPVTVSDVVMMGRFARQGMLRRADKADRTAVAAALDHMGISNLAGQPIGDLSGGQQQRVFLARALAQEPHILLMDEPFTGVDATTQEAVLRLLDELREEGLTVLVSTHDLSLAMQRFELVLLLNRELVAYGPPAAVFTPEHVRQAFGGQALMLGGMVVVDQCCSHEEEVVGV